MSSLEILSYNVRYAVNLTTLEVRKPILEGDRRGGGHRAGTGKPGVNSLRVGVMTRLSTTYQMSPRIPVQQLDLDEVVGRSSLGLEKK